MPLCPNCGDWPDGCFCEKEEFNIYEYMDLYDPMLRWNRPKWSDILVAVRIYPFSRTFWCHNLTENSTTYHPIPDSWGYW